MTTTNKVGDKVILIGRAYTGTVVAVSGARVLVEWHPRGFGVSEHDVSELATARPGGAESILPGR
jgi:hypothetical protein